MFQREICGPRCKYLFRMNSGAEAEFACAKYLLRVREIWRSLELYTRGDFLVLDGPVMNDRGDLLESQKNLVDNVARWLDKELNSSY